MNKTCILVVDIGTSKVHANCIDPVDGGLLANAAVAFPWQTPAAGWVEIHPEDIWQAAQEACRQMLERAGQGLEPVALTFSWFGANLVALDARGEAVYPLLVSFDARAEQEAAILQREIAPERAALVGRGGLNAQSNPAKLLWLKRHRPEAFSSIACVGTIQQYILRKLGLPLCYERSMAATLQLREVSGQWMTDLLSACGLSSHQVDYPCYEGDQIVGTVSSFGSVPLGGQVPVLLGGHDCIVSQLGCGVGPTPGGVLGEVSGTYDLMGFFRTGCTAPDGTPIQDCIDAPMAGVYSHMHGGPAGAMLSEAVERLWGKCDGPLLTQLFGAARFDGTGGGLWLRPDWESIQTDPNALARFGAQRVFESLVEQLTFDLEESYRYLCHRHGGPFQVMRVGGGAARSESWLRLKADVFGLRVERVANQEVSSVGAAIIAAVTLGIHESYDQALACMTKAEVGFDPDPARRQVYGQQLCQARQGRKGAEK